MATLTANDVLAFASYIPNGDCDGSGYGSGYGYNSGSGSGEGYGDGSGYGDSSSENYDYGDSSSSGSGSGSGSGEGYGNCFGYGDSDGSGDGFGESISLFGGLHVAIIDGVQTIIKSIRGDVARGAILNGDLTTTPTVVVRHRGYYAHGTTLREARDAVIAKVIQCAPPKERVETFLANAKKSYTGSEWSKIHHQLTGSCQQGREAFINSKGIDLTRQYTIVEFVEIATGFYGTEVIELLGQELA